MIFLAMKIRVGFGYDMHRLQEGKELWLGGVKLNWHMGLQGHSDADVLVHAICDALLGAANLRDIGHHFPDTAMEYKEIRSTLLLEKTIALLDDHGYIVGNIDTTVCAEQPKLNPYIPAMQERLAEVTGMSPDDISIKATTSERMGFVGREEGITAYAVVLIQKL